jgi:hypothetical protein
LWTLLEAYLDPINEFGQWDIVVLPKHLQGLEIALRAVPELKP